MHKKCHKFCQAGGKSRCLMFALLALALVLLGGLAVQLLWNWLTPALFGWKTLDFLQALGLLALCRILFGKMFCGGCRKRGHRQDLSQMTPEEREKLEAALKNCCND